MNNNPLNVNNNSAKAKSIRTFLQSIAGAIVAYLYGLWQLPGVSEYTNEFIKTQGFELLIGLAALIGIPAAVIAYLQNRKVN
jgi:hypothetical protein